MPAVRSRDRVAGRAGQPKPRSDAYTGLLLLALLAQVAGAVFLYIDWSRYPSTTPEKLPALAASPTVGGTPAAPAAPADKPAGPPAAPPMGGGVGMAGGAGMGGGAPGGVGMAGGAGMGGGAPGGVGMAGGGAAPPGK